MRQSLWEQEGKGTGLPDFLMRRPNFGYPEITVVEEGCKFARPFRVIAQIIVHPGVAEEHFLIGPLRCDHLLVQNNICNMLLFSAWVLQGDHLVEH